MKRKSITLGLAGLVGLSLFGAIVTGTRHVPARADATNYTNQKRQIRACVLISSASQDADATAGLYPSNVTPYVFYALDRPNDLKPAGIEFVNPLAPQVITQDIYNRWLSRSNGNAKNDRTFGVDGNGNPYPEATIFRVNAPISKNMGAYWEVNLDKVSAADLQQFDVIMLPIHGSRFGNGGKVAFTPLEREKMRHYVDAGGTIWMEPEGASNFTLTSEFTTETFFIGVDTVPGPNANAYVNVVAGHHPLVNYPYLLTQQDANSLSLQTQMNTQSFVGVSTGGSSRPLETALLPIIQKGNVTTVWAGDYGAGHVVIASARIAGDINNLLISSGPTGNAGSNVVNYNDGAVSGDNLGGIPASDMKFAYNLVNWISSVPAPGSNQRRTGSTQENIGSTLTTKWATIPITPANPLEPATVSNPGSGATIYKGMTFWVDGTNVFHAYDVNPTQSLSGTSQADDGLPDLIYGASYDEVYNDLGKRTLPDPGAARAATPTLISQYDPNSGSAYEMAVISTTDGGTYFYNAFPRNGLLLSPAVSQAFKQTSGGDMRDGLGDNTSGSNGGTATPGAGLPYAQPYAKPVPAPAYSDGVLFTLVFTNPKGTNGELGWRIAPVDMLASCRAGKALSVFDNGTAASADTQVAPNANWGGGLSGFYLPTGNVTVGEVKSSDSDAIDRIVYVPTAANPNNKQGGEIRGAWFSTRNEPLIGNPGGPYSPSGQRAHIPWYTGGTVGTIKLLPVAHVVRHGVSNGPVTGIDTYYYSKDFDISYPADGQYNKVTVTFHNAGGVTPPGANDEVFADFTVDWPGATVGNIAGALQPTQQDMDLITGPRHFGLYTPNFQQVTPETTGGLSLSSLDNLLFSVTNLHDMSQSGASGNPPLEDRIFSVRDQYLGQSATTASATTGNAPPRRATSGVNWMFSPMPSRQLDASFGGGVFGNYQVPARLTYNKNPIYNFKAIGAPVTSNGTVYVLGAGYLSQQGATSSASPDVTVLLALRENIDASLSIGPIAQNAQITLQQPSFLHPQTPITLRQGEFTLERIQDPATGNYTGVVHLNNMQSDAGAGDTINTAMPIFVVPAGAATGVGNTATPIVNPQTGFGVLDNLQYYVAFPTAKGGASGFTPTSGPSVSGNTLYFAGDQPTPGGVSSSVVSIDLVKAQQANGGAGQLSSLSFVSGTPTLTDSDIKSPYKGQPLATTRAGIHPPLGTTNVIIAPNAQGLVGLDNGLILIADNHRLLEVDAGGNAAWSMEATISQTSVGGNTLATGGLAIKSIPLAQPTTSRRYALNEFLVVDGGNNRIVGTNRGGTTRFEVSAFSDDMHFMRPGEPLTFNQPADVETFPEIYNSLSLYNKTTKVTYTAQGLAPYSVTHYLVADTGNYRIVDIVDIVDANGVTVTMKGDDGSFASGQKLLTFVTRSLGEQNEKYRYRTVQQFQFNGTAYIIATISNNRQANAGGAGILGNNSSNFEGPGGSLIAIQRSPTGPNPDPSKANALSAGDVYNVINSIVVLDANGNFRRQTISNPTWFKEYSTLDVTNSTSLSSPAQTPRFLMADANGCYVLRIGQVNLNGVQSTEYIADWMLTSQDYYYMTGRKLQATCIQRETLSDLSSRNLFESRLLITNGYSGVDDISRNFTQNFGYGFQALEPTTGEIFEIKADAYYPSATKNYYGYVFSGYQRYQPPQSPTDPGRINNNVITRMVPAEQPTFNANGKLNGTKRRIGTADNSLSTYTLQQPQYAEKPL